MARNNIPGSTWVTIPTPASESRERASQTLLPNSIFQEGWGLWVQVQGLPMRCVLCVHPHKGVLSMSFLSSLQPTGLSRSWLSPLEGASTVHARVHGHGLCLSLYRRLPGMLGTCPQTWRVSWNFVPLSVICIKDLSRKSKGDSDIYCLLWATLSFTFKIIFYLANNSLRRLSLHWVRRELRMRLLGDQPQSWS